MTSVVCALSLIEMAATPARRCRRATSMVAAQGVQVTPRTVAKMRLTPASRTGPSGDEEHAAAPSATSMAARRKVISRFSPIAVPQRHPQKQDPDGDREAQAIDRDDRACPAKPRTPPEQPALIEDARHSEHSEQRLKSLEPEETPCAQQGQRSKSCQDLRQHSSTGDEQRRDDRKHACRLGL